MERLYSLRAILKHELPDFDVQLILDMLADRTKIEIKHKNTNFAYSALFTNRTIEKESLYELAQMICKEVEQKLAQHHKTKSEFVSTIHDEVYNYKRFILTTRDFKKGKELLEDAVCHRVITQKEYDYLIGYTDGLRDGGKQNV